jgi:hypothetical protein
MPVTDEINDDILVGLSYIPLVIIVVGVLGNTSSFLIFICNQKLRKMSCMIFLSFIAIYDTLGLFTWNLNHFLQPNKLPAVESLSLAACRFFNFLQYFSLQCSGILYSMLSVDRYFTIMAIPGSFISKLPFGTHRSALMWCLSITLVLAVINCHMLFMHGFIKTTYVNATQPATDQIFNQTSNYTYRKDKVETLVCFVSEDGSYQINPMWDYANLVLYNFIPFILMAIFNTLLLMKTFGTNSNRKKSTTQDKKAKLNNRRKRRLTISLFIITFGFIVMTLPGSIVYGFFFDLLRPTAVGHAVLIACDCFLFSQHAMLFFMCLITNIFFRQAIVELFQKMSSKCRNVQYADTKNSTMTTHTESL